MFKVAIHLFAVAVMISSSTVFGQQPSLAEQIMDADKTQFAVIFPKLKEQADQEVPILIAEIGRKLPPDANDDTKGKLAKRQTNAAVALLKLNQPEKVWPLLKHSPDPRIRSYLIHRIGPLGVDPTNLIARLGDEPDNTIRRALLLSLGEYDEKALSLEDRKILLPKLQAIYREDADSGIHAASEWLLRQWNEETWLKRVNAEWAQNKEQRKKQLDRIEKSSATDKGSPQWYINGQGQTMAVIPGPVEFLMGSPYTEAGRKDRETQHKRRIGRTFSIATKPVTFEQYRRFEKDFPLPEAFVRTADVPVVNTSWHQAVAYCNWLSKEEGIPEDQWCFEIKGNKTKLKKNYLSLVGYRLPTEAETEYATRAETTTAWPFGESDELLPMYAWCEKNLRGRIQPVGRLKPNDLGLFDVQGNVWTWCQESYKAYPAKEDGEASEDQEDDLVVVDKAFRVLRGGCYSNPSSDIRSAFRNFNRPTFQFDAFGFRLARTIQPVQSTTPKDRN